MQAELALLYRILKFSRFQENNTGKLFAKTHENKYNKQI